jgi:hypothetical protein
MQSRRLAPSVAAERCTSFWWNENENNKITKEQKNEKNNNFNFNGFFN